MDSATGALIALAPMRILLVLAIPLAGCATILRSPTQSVSIASEPPGARATAEPGGGSITTPGTLPLRRKRPGTVRVEKVGYEPATIQLRSERDGEFWRNLIFLHPVAIIVACFVDIGNGSAYVLAPDPATVTLVPQR